MSGVNRKFRRALMDKKALALAVAAHEELLFGEFGMAKRMDALTMDLAKILQTLREAGIIQKIVRKTPGGIELPEGAVVEIAKP